MNITNELRTRLASLKALVFDVDGVLTQGDIVYTDSGEEAKAFDVKDGLGIRVAVDAGIRVAVMTGRTSSVLQRRARDLHITDILQRIGDKAFALRAFSAQSGIPLEHIAFMGDDVNDRGAMRICGLSMAPADAVPEIREQADLVTDARAGRGAARQVIEAVLRAQGRWDSEVDHYLAGLAERDRARRTQ